MKQYTIKCTHFCVILYGDASVAFLFAIAQVVFRNHILERPRKSCVIGVKTFFLRHLSRIYIGDIQHNIARNIAGIIAPYLLTLANRNYPICAGCSLEQECHAAQGAKESTTTVALMPFSLTHHQCTCGSMFHTNKLTRYCLWETF